ncbi:MAG TPA: ABC transporter permease [Segeticoccus sp.]|nr:ABC transporter permease [Segeticoccus sp.]HET8600237.1 ABC transporter permease [Segeticoccus sp.]
MSTTMTKAAAPPRTRVLAQARFEATTLLRNGEQLLVSLVLPALALVALHYAHQPSLGPGRRIDVVVPGALALAVLSTAFTGQAIATGFDRRYGVLRLLGVTPLGRTGLLLAKAVAVLVVELLQSVVLGAIGLALGWHPHWVGVLPALLVGLVGTWAFVALALLLAGTIRAEGVLALANLIWILLLGIGGVLIPRTVLPDGLSAAVRWLPSAALGDGLRTAFTTAHVALVPVLVLVGWGLVATVLASRLFRWSD